MAQRKPSVFKTEVLICARKYSIIDADGNVVVPRVNISFMTEAGYFAAPLPEGMDEESFRKYAGCELHELPFEKEDTFCAGKIESCTANGFYGRFYKDCIHRAREKRGFKYTIRSARWIETLPAGLWTYHEYTGKCFGYLRERIRRGEVKSLPDRKKSFVVTHSEETAEELVGAIVMLGWYPVGVVTGSKDPDTKEVFCIAAEVLLREMCRHKENIEAEIAEGRMEEEPEAEFIIHSGVLEKYQGDAETVVVPDSVHTIGEKAFQYNRTIVHLQLPQTVSAIEREAFEGCAHLQTVRFPDGLKKLDYAAFEMCSSLKSVELPNTLTEIGNSAFAYCESLVSVKLPKNLDTIGSSAFNDCFSLPSITIPDTVKTIKESAFWNCKKLKEIQLPESVQVEHSAFQHTPWLKNYVRKNGVLILGGKLLAVSEKLTQYEIPPHVHTIGSFAFFKSNIAELRIPESVATIEGYAFSGSKISRIYLPDNLKSIGDFMFADCLQLEELTIPKGVDDIGTCALHNLPNCVVTFLNTDEDAESGEYIFGDEAHPPCVKEVRVPYGSAAMRAARLWDLPCTYLEETPHKYTYIDEDFCCYGTTLVQYLGHKDVVCVPDGITEIGDYAFKDNYAGAEKIELSPSVHLIGIGSFMRCASLKEISGPGVLEIKGAAFAGAAQLERVCFPSLQTYANDAFNRCASLTEEGLLIPESAVVGNTRMVRSR